VTKDERNQKCNEFFHFLNNIGILIKACESKIRFVSSCFKSLPLCSSNDFRPFENLERSWDFSIALRFEKGADPVGPTHQLIKNKVFIYIY
jgi:hypothetical protein